MSLRSRSCLRGHFYVALHGVNVLPLPSHLASQLPGPFDGRTLRRQDRIRSAAWLFDGCVNVVAAAKANHLHAEVLSLGNENTLANSVRQGRKFVDEYGHDLILSMMMA